MKRQLLLAVCLTAFLPLLNAQSNELIDTVLEAKSVAFGDIASLILQSQDKIRVDSDRPEAAVTAAMDFLQSQRWFSLLPKATAKATLGQVAFLIMKTFRYTGGAGWSLIPNTRSATRELGFRKALYFSNQSPFRPLSGFEALNLLHWALEHPETSGAVSKAEDPAE